MCYMCVYDDVLCVVRCCCDKSVESSEVVCMCADVLCVGRSYVRIVTSCV